MTIGFRAYTAVKQKAQEEKITVKQECENLEVTEAILNGWKKSVYNPRSDVLQRMAMKGYDIYYILLGEDYVNC